MVKAVAVVGSRRRNGNTSTIVTRIMERLEEAGFETETINLGDFDIEACDGCDACSESNACVKDDGMSRVYDMIDEADALVLGSPTYFYNVSSDMKRFIDRMYCRIRFHPEDRAVWESALPAKEKRFAVTVSVCEQQSRDDMGFTPEAMRLTLECLGFRVIDEVMALSLFNAGDVNGSESLDDADRASQRLIRYLEL